MYVDCCRTHGKYKRYLLRESFRQNGQVKHRTIANLSGCSPEEIRAIQLALSHKEQLEELLESNAAVELQQGLSVGAVWLVYQMARQLGIAEALGNTREGKLALWQVLARVIEQGSRLSAVRLAGGMRPAIFWGWRRGLTRNTCTATSIGWRSNTRGSKGDYIEGSIRRGSGQNCFSMM